MLKKQMLKKKKTGVELLDKTFYQGHGHNGRGNVSS